MKDWFTSMSRTGIVLYLPSAALPQIYGSGRQIASFAHEPPLIYCCVLVEFLLGTPPENQILLDRTLTHAWRSLNFMP